MLVGLYNTLLTILLGEILDARFWICLRCRMC